ncbi:hepcidin [Spea bombifrons]|uniref:hepcidin n=1 Tax=Spea bombifrons TaxID=233779 RepID=UPI00234BC0C3|nr:hepcidin [Spea bombifrons]
MQDMACKLLAVLLFVAVIGLVASRREEAENKTASDNTLDPRSGISEGLQLLRARRSVLGLCYFCCGCCRKMKGCGMCCRT